MSPLILLLVTGGSGDVIPDGAMQMEDGTPMQKEDGTIMETED